MPFVEDSFTDTADTTLASHTGETGATWTKHANWTGTIHVTSGGRLYLKTAGNNVAIYGASGTPATADYDVQATVRRVTGVSGQEIGVFARLSLSANNWYWFRYSHNNARWELFRGTALLATYSQTLTNGTDYVIKLTVRGTSIKGYVGGVERVSATDSAVSAAGLAGVYIGGAVSTDTTGYHLDDFSATDAEMAGTASVTTIGLTTATVTSTSPVGGTAPYTYQWYRDTVTGFTPGVGNAVSGATSLTLNDTGLTRGSTYYYVLRVTDNTAATDDTNEISLTTKTSQIVVDGNSNSVRPDSFDANGGLADLIPSYWQIDNESVFAQTTEDQTADALSEIVPYLSGDNTGNVVIHQEVMNHIYFGATAQEAYDELVTYSGIVRGVNGSKLLVILPIPDRGDFPGTSTLPGADAAAKRAEYVSRVAAFSTLFYADWTTFADAYYDPADHSGLSDPENTTYYDSDKVHWKAAADAVVAQGVADAMAGLLLDSVPSQSYTVRPPEADAAWNELLEAFTISVGEFAPPDDTSAAALTTPRAELVEPPAADAQWQVWLEGFAFDVREFAPPDDTTASFSTFAPLLNPVRSPEVDAFWDQLVGSWFHDMGPRVAAVLTTLPVNPLPQAGTAGKALIPTDAQAAPPTREALDRIREPLNSLMADGRLVRYDVRNRKWTITSGFNATRAPAATDDVTIGAQPGMVWADTDAQTVYVCVANTAGAAVWLRLVTA